MKRKFITCIYLVLFFICAKQLFTYMYNENLISKYNKQVYHTSTAPLFVLNFFEPYIAHYNAGNIYYQNGEYSNAIKEYEKALEKKTPKFKECSIRINIALSMIGLIGEDYDAPENIDATIDQLKEARSVLTENGCANEDGDGHSDTAEKLKEEIDALIEELENKKTGSSSSQDDEDKKQEEEKKQEQKTDDTKEANIKEQLQQQQSDSYLEREAEIQSAEEWNMEINFDTDEGIW